jgi:hypothetical protein
MIFFAQNRRRFNPLNTIQPAFARPISLDHLNQCTMLSISLGKPSGTIYQYNWVAHICINEVALLDWEYIVPCRRP